jgi:hypothetical protein
MEEGEGDDEMDEDDEDRDEDEVAAVPAGRRVFFAAPTGKYAGEEEEEEDAATPPPAGDEIAALGESSRTMQQDEFNTAAWAFNNTNGFDTSAKAYSNSFTVPLRPVQQLDVEDLPMEDLAIEEGDLDMEGNIPPRAMSPDWTKDPLDPRNK